MIFNDINSLAQQIHSTDQILRSNAYAVINRSVTARAWLTGMYIVEYEQHGNDRAQYGERLLEKLSEKLGGNSFSVSSLKKYRRFYMFYPQLAKPLANYLVKEFQGYPQIYQQLTEHPSVVIGQTAVAQLENNDKLLARQKGQPLVTQFDNEEYQQVVSVSRDGFAQQLEDGTVEPVPQMLFDRISYSQFTLLIYIDDPLKRTFLAIETMRGPWSKRELKRQISSNYYERSGWSKKPELLATKVNATAEKPSLTLLQKVRAVSNRKLSTCFGAIVPFN